MFVGLRLEFALNGAGIFCWLRGGSSHHSSFDRAAADVEHQRMAPVRVEEQHAADEGELRLLGRGDDFEVDPPL